MLNKSLFKQRRKYSALVSHQQKAVWYKVRKCASISIGKSLPGDDWVAVNNNRNYRQFENEYFGNYFRFAIVRNPFPEVSHSNKTGDYNYRDFYSSSLEQKVADRYARDLELFGYEFDKISDSPEVHGKVSGFISEN